MPEKHNFLWSDRKRTLFGLPWSFTNYKVTEEKLFIITGFFSTKEEEIRLYRILDMTLKRSLGEKVFGLGTIHLCTADKSTPEIDIKRIKDSSRTRDMLSDLVEKERTKKGIASREYLGHDDDGNGGFHS